MQTCEIVILMTRAALHAGNAFAIRSASHVHGVRMTVVALAREISLGVAVDAARVAQDRDNRFEGTNRSRVIGLTCGTARGVY
jgi:hypothetical protein